MAEKKPLSNTLGIVTELSSSDTIPAANVPAMVGDSGAGGTKGAAPAPAAGDAAAGKFLKADGTWAAPGGSSAYFTWNEVTGTSQAMAVGSAYIANNASLVTLTLPTTAAVGDRILVAGKGSGGWRIAQNASELIRYQEKATTTGTGGYIESVTDNDTVQLVCIVADTEWLIVSLSNRVKTDTGLYWGAGWQTVMKAAIETTTGDTTLTADSALFVPMAANTKYAIRGVIMFDTTAAADFKWRHSGPASPTQVRIRRWYLAAGANGNAAPVIESAYSVGDMQVTGTQTNGGTIWIDAIIENGANAGNFEIQWAQNTSDAGNTSVLPGSYLEYYQL